MRRSRDRADHRPAQRALGADLAEPREILHFLYLPAEDAAHGAADEVRHAGYGTEVRPSADPSGGKIVS